MPDGIDSSRGFYAATDRNWPNHADQTIIETTLSYEQVAVDLTSNLAKNEPDPYVRQTLDSALLEDFDHLYRYSCLYDYMEGGHCDLMIQGKTEIKPGRPTVAHHRHLDDTMRRHYDKDAADIKTKMNCVTNVAGETQTELFDKEHGFMYSDELARHLYLRLLMSKNSMRLGVGCLEILVRQCLRSQLLCNYVKCISISPAHRLKAIPE